MNSQIITKFNSFKPLERTIIVVALFIASLIAVSFAPYLFLLSIILTIIILRAVNSHNEELEMLRQLELRYKNSLDTLSKNPRDIDIYMMVLALGRKHYRLMTVGTLNPNDQLIINDITPIFQAEYNRSLNVLRKSPQDSTLRQEALEVARMYYDTMRGGVNTIYDEQAISNDLSTIYGSDIDTTA